MRRLIHEDEDDNRDFWGPWKQEAEAEELFNKALVVHWWCFSSELNPYCCLF